MPFYRGMTCENVTINGDKGTPITAYVAKPSGPSSFPGVVLIHHLPGWSEFYVETTRRSAHHGYLAICANLTSARVEAATAILTMSPPRRAPRAALLTRRWSGTPKAR
jgi:dienelactone hydrolase